MKKSLIRSTQWFNQKVLKHKKTKDEEFNRLYARVYEIKDTTSATIKHINQLIENFFAMSTTLQYVGEDFKIIYDSGSNKKKQAESVISLSEEIEKNIVIPFKEFVTENCLDSLGGYIAKYDAFPELKKTRDNLLLEFDYHKEQVAKLTAKPSKNPLSLPRAKEKLSLAKKEYETVNEEFKEKMQEIINMKDEIFSPVFGIVIKRLVKYNVELSQALSSKLSGISGGSSSFTSSSGSKTTNIKSNIKKKAIKVKNNLGKPPKHLDIDWFYLDDNLQQKGPVSLKALTSLVSKGTVNGNTNVFGGEMSDWATISKLSDLKKYLGL